MKPTPEIYYVNFRTLILVAFRLYICYREICRNGDDVKTLLLGDTRCQSLNFERAHQNQNTKISESFPDKHFVDQLDYNLENVELKTMKLTHSLRKACSIWMQTI